MKITVPTIDFGTSKIVTMVAQSNGERYGDIVGLRRCADAERIFWQDG